MEAWTMREQSKRKQNENTIIQNPYKKMLTTVIKSLAHKLLPGVAVVKSGDEINIDGIGPTYEGRYYVEEVKHLYSSTGYRQSFMLTRSATGSAPGGDKE